MSADPVPDAAPYAVSPLSHRVNVRYCGACKRRWAEEAGLDR